jgi:SAM-dependent methyltransferase
MHEHKFIPSVKYDNYEVCVLCGTLHSTAQIDPNIIYIEKEYWGDGTGRSTLEQQISNFTCIDDCGISKADRIMQFVPQKGNIALEIACAPGVVLSRLTERFTHVLGIEPSEKYIRFILEQAPKASVIQGFFPQVTAEFKHESVDCIVAVDVMEHVEDFKYFFGEIWRLLVNGGTAVIMSPIILTQDEFIRQRDMEHPDEHCWIFSEKYLREFLEPSFAHVEFRTWIVGHNLIILKK